MRSKAAAEQGYPSTIECRYFPGDQYKLMPRKLDPDSTPSMKVVQMAFFLLFSGRKYSLTDLARKFNCSKPTILRIICQLEGIDGLVIHSEQ